MYTASRREPFAWCGTSNVARATTARANPRRSSGAALACATASVSPLVVGAAAAVLTPESARAHRIDFHGECATGDGRMFRLVVPGCVPPVVATRVAMRIAARTPSTCEPSGNSRRCMPNAAASRCISWSLSRLPRSERPLLRPAQWSTHARSCDSEMSPLLCTTSRAVRMLSERMPEPRAAAVAAVASTPRMHSWSGKSGTVTIR